MSNKKARRGRNREKSKLRLKMRQDNFPNGGKRGEFRMAGSLKK